MPAVVDGRAKLQATLDKAIADARWSIICQAACEGYANPMALRDMVEHVRAYVKAATFQLDGGHTLTEELQAVLAKLDKPADAEGGG